MATYNGHKNYSYWNVALWLGNDEGLYRTAVDINRANPNANNAAQQMLTTLHELGVHQTPDNVTYTRANLRAALIGLKS